MNDDETETIFWAALGGLYLLVACLCMLGCAFMPAVQHPRAAQIDFTKPIPEIPEQAW